MNESKHTPGSSEISDVWYRIERDDPGISTKLLLRKTCEQTGCDPQTVETAMAALAEGGAK